ncbi:hypothetical protein GCM10010873_26010 [Cypionkella aquatica]|uniref:Hedgehog/Intein (Hint) domain-containing protein n=1 Tax=Cypionkella aquatica TaxID=1756042 RepID=A0AA37U0Q4_9RHOB|nr:Hint domain-containing protein [Cypionkella aquatica]GLS87627.1 hypothetical protein GCM10010873_26010 [Cypionkella aquatica]
MAVFSFSVISNDDIGLSPNNFSEGTFTVGGAPRMMTVADDDGILDDESSEDGLSHSDYQTNAETFDPSGQLLGQDIDGLGASGHIVQSVYKFTIYNASTGQTGTAYMLRIYNGSDPATFMDDWGGGQLGPYYYAFDIPVAAGDSITLSNGDWRGQAQYDALVNGVPCFVAGTLIATPDGERAVETLGVGDLVFTQDAGAQPIAWCSARYLDARDLGLHPGLRPVRIAAGALGAGVPQRDLLVSPQHRILVASDTTHRVSGAREVLVAAKHLLGLPGISVDLQAQDVTYVHFLCPAHQVVFAQGAATESMLPGAQALRSLSPQARAEVLALFPELGFGADATPQGPVPARPCLNGRHSRNLAARHHRSGKSLVQSAG